MVSITPEVGRPQRVRIIYSNGKSVFLAFVDFGLISRDDREVLYGMAKLTVNIPVELLYVPRGQNAEQLKKPKSSIVFLGR